MSFSYWEHQSWFNNIDCAVIGSGIVGLNCALRLRERFPKARIVVFERGILPSGASTKNAGFACFGSVSEILDDLQQHSEQEVVDLVKQRVNGLERLKSMLGTKTLEYHQHGGYELFHKADWALRDNCLEQLAYVNALLKPIFKTQVFCKVSNDFGFDGIHSDLIFNQFEGQINTGKMMRGLLKLALSKDITIINGAQLDSLTELNNGVAFRLNQEVELQASRVFVATNGFAAKLLELPVKPARAQVLVTQPIPDLKIKGTFHLDRGYNYFRNIDNRILLGGGRNLDVVGETTTDLGLSQRIQEHLEKLLHDTILPSTHVVISERWSGIMGVGDKKSPVVKAYSDRVFCGVRLGGMGVAIGSDTGRRLADLA